MDNNQSANESFDLGRLPLKVPPKLMLLIMALSIFTAEALVMVVLRVFDFKEYWIETLLDSSSLLMILTPVYLFFYRPFWEAQKQHEKQIRYLSQSLIKSVEDERKRITSELHDQSGQALTALQFGLQTLKRCIPGTESGCIHLTENLIEQTAQLSNNLRTFASRLRPETIDQLGLIAALEVEFRKFSETYTQIQLEHRLVRKSDLEGVIDGAGELAIYRVCQESLTNIVKHAKATQIMIQLSLVDKDVILQIEDNGSGFDINRYWLGRQSMGVGLLGMRERVSQLKGSFDIQSTKNQGTRLQVTLPYLERQKNGTN
jgi:signal transduction histidine kinase